MEIPVTIEKVVFKKENGFAILGAKLDIYSNKYDPDMLALVEECINKKYDTFTITVGMMPYEENPVGGQYVFVGEFVFEKKYNCKQFKAEFYYQDVPTTIEGLKAFFMTLPNIKGARSQAIVNKFGVEGAIEILDNDIYRLTEIAGITEKRIPPIKKAWDENKALREIYAWFIEHKIQLGLAKRAYKQWGNTTLKIVQENPYRLVEIYGIGFVTADVIAHKVNQDFPVDFRVTACIKYLLDEAVSKDSNLCLPYAILKKKLRDTLYECDQSLGKKADPDTYVEMVAKCLKNKLETFTIVKDLDENAIYVYLRKIWKQEFFIAKTLHNRKVFNHVKEDCSEKDLDKAEKDVSKFSGFKVTLDERQREAIKTAFEHKVSVITGPGGSGKSTICRCIFAIAQERGLSVRMMSPTGKAAQVLSEKTGCSASTIHRGLQLRPGDDKPKQSISEDILLVDETSMCGIETIYAICQALIGNEYANIILVGDKNQLPSVSPGNFLSDIIESGCANVVSLNKIHRQDENSYISLLANEISKGKVVEIPPDAADLKWHSLHADSFYDELNAFIDEYVSSGKSMNDLQLISPMKKGVCGVYNLNTLIQKKMATINGTTDTEMVFGQQTYCKGDRIIQTENNYDKMVFNGDMGIIKDLGERVKDLSVSDKKEKFIVVEIYGDEIEYYGEEIDQLQLAWVITVHKFQGSQSKYVVFVMADEARVMMSKELVYTAFTRAAKQLDVFGHENMLRLAPTRSIIRKRYTNLKKVLEAFNGSRKVLDVMEKKEEEKR